MGSDITATTAWQALSRHHAEQAAGEGFGCLDKAQHLAPERGRKESDGGMKRV